MITAMTDTRTEAVESKTWNVKTTIEKYASEQDHADGVIAEVFEDESNLLLNAGITRMINLLTGAGGTAYNAANSRIGVGISNTAAAAAQTDLQGATKYYKLVDSVTPTAQTITWIATFPTGQGNFAWEEWGIDNGAADSAVAVAPMLNRKVVSMGTKTVSAVWVFTVTITIA